MRTIHWFRNELRIRDITALSAAVERADELLPVFILDPHLFVVVRPVPRPRFLLDCLRRLAGDLAQRGSVLAVRTGDPVREIPRLMEETGADLLTYNRDVTPYARLRDEQVGIAVRRMGRRALDFKDRSVFESRLPPPTRRPSSITKNGAVAWSGSQQRAIDIVGKELRTQSRLVRIPPLR